MGNLINPPSPRRTLRGYGFAALLPAVFILFEAISIAAYPELRAPNVGPVQQVVLMGGIIAVWVTVPRLIWTWIPGESFSLRSRSWHRAALRLGGLGLVLASIHLLLLTAVLRLMHAPAGGQVSDFLRSYSEVVVIQAPIWFLAFGVAICVMAFVKTRRSDRMQRPERIQVRDRGQARLVELHDIEWVQARGNYVEFHLTDGLVTTRQSLQSLQGQLEAAGFVASHLGVMINSSHVRAIRAGGEGQSYRIVLKSGGQAPLSRRRLKSFRSQLLHPPSSG